MSRIASATLAALTLLSAASVEAQHAVPRFEPTPAGDRFYATASADVPGHAAVHGGLVLDYAHRSFVFRDRRNDVVSALVGETLLAHAQLSLALWNRLEISASLPIALMQSGDDPRYRGQQLESPSSAAVGDLRIGARVRLLGARGAPIQLAISGYLWAPTGSKEDYLSDGKVRGAPFLNASGRHKRFIWAGQAGVELRHARTLFGAPVGSMVRLGAALGAVVGKRERGQLGLELNGQMVMREVDSTTSGLELLASGKWRFVRDMELGAGAGPGLVGGIGTPVVRALASLMYTPWQEEPAAKPVAPLVAQAEQPAQEPALPPTPTADHDGDGLDDAYDACPNEKGPAEGARPGCPAPAAVAAAEPAPAALAEEKLIGEEVRFKLGSDELTPAQLTHIDAVAERMQREPTKKLTIEGHGDDLGGPVRNQQLSEQRAEAARDALVKRGVAKERMQTVGYGSDRPVVDRKTDPARSQNRRVEFVLHD